MNVKKSMTLPIVCHIRTVSGNNEKIRSSEGKSVHDIGHAAGN